MSHATHKDLVFDFGNDPIGTACAAARYSLDTDTAYRFKLQRSNAKSFRRAVGTKPRRPLSK